MSTDLESRFDQLVAHEPGGDAEGVLAGATRALARRERRRRAVLAGGVGVVVLAAVLAAVQVGGNDDVAPIVDETPTTTTVPTRVIAADDGEIAVSLTLPERLVAGERVWAELEVRNIGDRPLWWQAGGGTPPVSAALLLHEVVEPGVREWTGEGEPDLSKSDTIAFVEPKHTGLPSVMRTLELQWKELAPGATQRFRVSADLRSPVAGRDGFFVTARVSARFYNQPTDYEGPDKAGARPDVTAEARLPASLMTEDVGSALAAFRDDPRLARFVDDTSLDGVAGAGWYAELGWWRGAWELTVTPEYSVDPNGQSRYRMRWRDGKIIDARRIWWDQAAADDPEGTRYPDAPPDEVDER
jgi:hypothetical protein